MTELASSIECRELYQLHVIKRVLKVVFLNYAKISMNCITAWEF